MAPHRLGHWKVPFCIETLLLLTPNDINNKESGVFPSNPSVPHCTQDVAMVYYLQAHERPYSCFQNLSQLLFALFSLLAPAWLYEWVPTHHQLTRDDPIGI